MINPFEKYGIGYVRSDPVSGTFNFEIEGNWVCYWVTASPRAITLDGEFTVDELRALVDMMDANLKAQAQ